MLLVADNHVIMSAKYSRALVVSTPSFLKTGFRGPGACGNHADNEMDCRAVTPGHMEQRPCPAPKPKTRQENG